MMSTFSCAYIVAKPYVATYGLATIYAHTKKSRNRNVIKFAAFVYVVCDTMCTKVCSKRTTFDRVIIKKLKIPMDPSLWSLEWPPSVLI